MFCNVHNSIKKIDPKYKRQKKQTNFLFVFLDLFLMLLCLFFLQAAFLMCISSTTVDVLGLTDPILFNYGTKVPPRNKWGGGKEQICPWLPTNDKGHFLYYIITLLCFPRNQQSAWCNFVFLTPHFKGVSWTFHLLGFFTSVLKKSKQVVFPLSRPNAQEHNNEDDLTLNALLRPMSKTTQQNRCSPPHLLNII